MQQEISIPQMQVEGSLWQQSRWYAELKFYRGSILAQQSSVDGTTQIRE